MVGLWGWTARADHYVFHLVNEWWDYKKVPLLN